MEVSPSKMDHFEHKTAEKDEHFLGVPFRIQVKTDVKAQCPERILQNYAHLPRE